jgi:hypothetical protein
MCATWHSCSACRRPKDHGATQACRLAVHIRSNAQVRERNRFRGKEPEEFERISAGRTPFRSRDAIASPPALRSSPQGHGPACPLSMDSVANTIRRLGAVSAGSAAALAHAPERRVETTPKGAVQAVRGPFHFSRLARWTCLPFKECRIVQPFCKRISRQPTDIRRRRAVPIRAPPIRPARAGCRGFLLFHHGNGELPTGCGLGADAIEEAFLTTARRLEAGCRWRIPLELPLQEAASDGIWRLEARPMRHFSALALKPTHE